MIELILYDAHKQNTRAPSFAVREFGGDEICRSVTPIYEAARHLLAAGRDPDELVTAYHQGSLTAINKPAKLGHLAKWAVSEGNQRPTLREWTPHFAQKADPSFRK